MDWEEFGQACHVARKGGEGAVHKAGGGWWCSDTPQDTVPSTDWGACPRLSRGLCSDRALWAWWVEPSQLLAHCSAGGEPEEQKQEKLWVKIMMV